MEKIRPSKSNVRGVRCPTCKWLHLKDTDESSVDATTIKDEMKALSDGDQAEQLEPCRPRGQVLGEIYSHPSYLRHWIYDPYLHLYDSYVEPSESEYYTSRFHLRRRLHNARHICPMLGAAPFVSCYHCLELLELPLDFLVLSKRNRVKCSSCSSILEFAVVDDNKHRRHLVPYKPKFMDSLKLAQDKGKRKMVDK